MSHNAEPKAKIAAINQAEWASLSEREKAAVRAATRAYTDSPGDHAEMAMLRGCRAYVNRYKDVAPEHAK